MSEKRQRSIFAAIMAATALLASPGSGAQCNPVAMIEGTIPEMDAMGHAVANAGDVDGDGVPDVIIGCLHCGPEYLGEAVVYSGESLNELFRFHGEANEDFYAEAVGGAGDSNADGHADVIVGAPRAGGEDEPGRAYLYSGLDGVLLLQLEGRSRGSQFGHSVDGVGDVNGDGIDDVVIGAPATNLAYVVSGANGEEIYELAGDGTNELFGEIVANAGDTNRDGVNDILVGAPENASLGVWTGKVYLFSGVNGAELSTFPGQTSDTRFGDSADGIGDVDGDGAADIAVGAPRDSSNTGSVYIYSGATGAELFTFNGIESGDRFGVDVAGAGDANADGVPDILIGASHAASPNRLRNGTAYVFSGLDGALMLQANPYPWTRGLGASVDGGLEIVRDGRSDFVIGAHEGGSGGAGQAYFYRGGCVSYAMDVDPLFSGRPAEIRVRGATPLKPQYVVLSLSGAGGVYIPSLEVYLDLENPILILTAPADEFGEVDWTIIPPPISRFRHVWLQVAELYNVTNVVDQTIN